MLSMEKSPHDRVWPFAAGSGATLAVAAGIIIVVALLWFWLPDSLLLDIFLFVGVFAGLLIFYFFRDPNRRVLRQDGMVIAPADGKIVAIERETEPIYLQKEMTRISIFLSILDVHVQRAPIGGKVALVDHRPGKFLQAFRPEASDVNEYIAMLLETKYGQVLVKQIAGILARRCVNYTTVGENLRLGQRFGLIKFSSRVDLFLPPETHILAQVGDQVYGGLTLLARFQIGEDYEE